MSLTLWKSPRLKFQIGREAHANVGSCVSAYSCDHGSHGRLCVHVFRRRGWSLSSIVATSSSISGCSAPASGSTSWSVSRCCSCWWFHLSASPLHSCPVVAHLRLFRSCVWLYILVRLLLLVVPSVSSSPPSVLLRRYLAHKIQDTCPRELV